MDREKQPAPPGSRAERGERGYTGVDKRGQRAPLPAVRGRTWALWHERPGLHTEWSPQPPVRAMPSALAGGPGLVAGEGGCRD